MWEIIARQRGAILWRGRDAEGRPIYAVTVERPDGMALEPHSNFYMTKKAAWEAFRRDRAAEASL